METVLGGEAKGEPRRLLPPVLPLLCAPPSTLGCKPCHQQPHHTRTYTRALAHTRADTRAQTHAQTRACAHAHACGHVHTHAHVCADTHTRTYMCTHAHACAQTRTHTQTRAHTRAHAHTHTGRDSLHSLRCSRLVFHAQILITLSLLWGLQGWSESGCQLSICPLSGFQFHWVC